MRDLRLIRALMGPLSLAAASLLVAVGCSSPSIDPGQLQADLRNDLGAVGAGITGITCPSGQPAKAGTTFTCTAQTEQGELVYDVSVTSDAGAYRYDLAPGQTVDSAALANELTAQITGADGQVPGVAVACPPSIIAPAGAVDVVCTATRGTAQVPMHVTGAPGSPLTWVFATS